MAASGHTTVAGGIVAVDAPRRAGLRGPDFPQHPTPVGALAMSNGELIKALRDH
jgi:hypothetical protein